MPELGTEAEGRHLSDTHTSGRGTQALGRSTPSQGLEYRLTLGELGHCRSQALAADDTRLPFPTSQEGEKGKHEG